MTYTGYLARVVMFDQGSRTAFRGTAKAFAYDNLAKDLALETIAKNWFIEKYQPVERQMMITPLLHSEDIAAHVVAGEYVHRLGEGASEEVQKFFEGVPVHLLEHTQVVRQFGRYPSRNASLVS